MSEDERAIRERLAALENEVKAEATAQKRKDAALELVRAERAERAAKAAAKEAAARPRPAKPARDDDDGVLEELAASASRRRRDVGDVGNALELARRAQSVKQELAKPTGKGDKSWMLSAGVSTMLGPLGWLYAGSWREAVPATAGWLVLFYLANLILPTVLLIPMVLVALPLSGLAGMLYAVSYNRHGSRQRLFGEDKPKPPKGLPSSDEE